MYACACKVKAEIYSHSFRYFTSVFQGVSLQTRFKNSSILTVKTRDINRSVLGNLGQVVICFDIYEMNFSHMKILLSL
jgi:hypothetical protein